jgi:hypothetical protein
MNLFKVVLSGTKKAIEDRSFSKKEDAKFFRDSLNANTSYDAKEDISGRAMPFNVSKDVQHNYFKKG